VFYGCDQYPGCDYVSWDKPTNKPCPQCNDAKLVEKRNRSGVKLLCPTCAYSEEVADEEEQD
jgi:DNA topoisomerase-1